MKLSRGVQVIVCAAGLLLVAAGFTPRAQAADPFIQDGDIIALDSSYGEASWDVYIVKTVGSKQFRRLILNPHVFDSYGHLKWKNLKRVNERIMNGYKESQLVRVDGKQEVFALEPNGDEGTRSWVRLSAEDFRSVADPDSIYTINHTDFSFYTPVDSIDDKNLFEFFYRIGFTVDEEVFYGGGIDFWAHDTNDKFVSPKTELTVWEGTLENNTWELNQEWLGDVSWFPTAVFEGNLVSLTFWQNGTLSPELLTDLKVYIDDQIYPASMVRDYGQFYFSGSYILKPGSHKVRLVATPSAGGGTIKMGIDSSGVQVVSAARSDVEWALQDSYNHNNVYATLILN